MSDALKEIIDRLRQNKQTRDVATALEIMCEQRVPSSERATVPSIDVDALTSRVAALENADHESPLSMHQRLIALEEHKTADIASIDRRLRVLEPCPRARVGQDHSWSGDHGKTCAACGLTRD